MKKLVLLLLVRLVAGFKAGKDEYIKTISKEDPSRTLYIFGWLGNIGKGLWNGVKGALGGFFGGGGAVTVKGGRIDPGAPIIITEPTPKDEDKKPNILLYIGIGVAALVFVIVLVMVLKKK